MNAQQAKIQCAVWRSLRLAGVSIDTPGAIDVVRSITWLVSQQPLILTRFPLDQNDLHTREGIGKSSYWNEKLSKFLVRADLLTLESPEGRQAIFEHFATSLGLSASVWRCFGMPAGADKNYQQNSDLIKIE